MTFGKTDVTLSTVLLLLLLGISVAGIAVADASFGADSEDTDSAAHAAANVDIDGALADADGEVHVIVRFEPADRMVVQASADPVETLKAEASASQRPLQRYATRTDGVTVEKELWLANAALVRVDTERISLDELARIDGVEGIHENARVEISSTVPAPAASPTEPGSDSTTLATGTTYGLEQISATEVWNGIGTKGAGAKVAVLDTGIDVGHPDIELYTEDATNDSYPGGWAEFDGYGNRIASTPYDSDWHGTHVSGTVAGGAANGDAIGVAPDVNLMHGLVLPSGSGNTSQIIAGMQWAVQENADVISMSLGSSCDVHSPVYNGAITSAEMVGSIVIASSGNDGEGCASTPGSDYDSVSVGASAENESIWKDSSGDLVKKSDFYGTPPTSWPAQWIDPDVSAPGHDILSAVPTSYGLNSDRGIASGTSMAAPHVSGTVGLMEAATARDLQHDEIKDALEQTAWKPNGENRSAAVYQNGSQDSRYGYGIIDAYAATMAVTTGTVNGTVTGAQTGAVIEGATVTIDAKNSGWRNTTQTDANGDYRFENASELDEYAVTVTAEGYEASSKTVAPVGMTTATEDFSLDGNATLEGTVVDAAEQSQAAISERPVDITVTYEDDSSFSTSATTAADGTVQLPALRGSSAVDLTLSAAGYHTTTIESIQVADDEDVSGVTIALTGNATLSGTVTNSGGDALPGSTVAVENGSRTYENATASDGSYEVSLPGTGARYNLSVDAVGYAPWNESGIEIDGDVTRDITLTAGTTLSGTVTDSETGARLPSITVTVEETTGDGTKVATTDETGSYAVGVAENTAYNLSIDADGYEPWNATDVQIGTGAVTENAALIGAADVRYHVNDRLAEAPIENATVSLTNDLTGTYNGTTDAGGRVTIENVSSAVTYARSVDAEGYRANETLIEVDGGRTEETLSLLGDATVQGVISDAASNAPLSGATVTVVYPDGTTVVGSNVTGDDGSFSVEGLPGDGSTYDVEVTAPGYDSNVYTIQANESEDVSFDRTLAGDASINGTVSERRSGGGVGGAAVTLSYSDGTATVDGITTNENGEFTVSDVPGTGDNYTVTVAATGYESTTNDSVAVASDAETPVDLTLTGAAAIDGTIVDPNVSPPGDRYIENATVTVTYPDGVTSAGPVRSDANGNFSVENLPGTDETYVFSVGATGYETQSSGVMVDENGVSYASVPLFGNASINGTVTSSDGVKLPWIAINATSESGTSYKTTSGANGAYQLEQVPGTGENYTVSLSHPLFENASVAVSDLTSDESDVNATLTQKAHYFAIGKVSAPDTATEGDTVEISANIANFGSADGERPVRLLVNGTESARQNVSLNATDSLETYDNTTVAFAHVPESPGEVTYTIETDEETRSVAVTVEKSAGGGLPALPSPPPDEEPAEPVLEIVEHALSATEIETGGTISVETTVANTGDAAGSTTLELTVDGEAVDEASVDVEAGENEVAAFETTIHEPGEYEVAVDGEVIGTVTALEPEANGETNETDDGSDSEGGASDDDGLPGFGVGVAVVALVSIALAARRQH